MEFRPHMAEAEDGMLVIDHGTKGGRPRKLPNIELGDKERAIIAWARGMQPAHGGRMVPEGISLETYMRKFYRFTAKIGLTRKHLGRTPHALRHERLQLIFEWLTGHAPPIRGGTLAATDPASDRAARRIVAEFAGHGRIHASSAYLGSMRPGHSSQHCLDVLQEQNDAGATQQPVGSGIDDDSSERKTD